MLLLTAFILLSAFSCGTNNNKTNSVQEPEKNITVKAPQFDADSAYKYIQAQVDFGPRNPNSKGHAACGEYLATKLAEHGAKVTNQNVELPAYDGTLLKARNIIGSFKPESKKRIALLHTGIHVRGQTMIPTRRITTHQYWVPTTERAVWACCLK